MVQISALFLGFYHAEEVSLVTPKANFFTMESISMLHPKCSGVLLIAWGEPNDANEGDEATWLEASESYHGMKLVLDQYEELAGIVYN
mmetsp:Transcript_12658/g.18716  ORF Transcript_12658/g.18716 Transcript_12658/m.18716 type:complete len:88 (-) Transcript_12658:16-279(-)